MTTVVPLGDEHHEQASRLGRLAFGGDLSAPPPPLSEGPPTRDAWGVLDDRGRLVAKAALLDLEHWWGGRRVTTGGVAGVAVHPDARGTGVATALLRTLADVMRDRGQGLSSLFPTVAGLYRRLGWEVVGSLDATRLTTRALLDADAHLQASSAAAAVTVRTAEPEEAPALHQLYSQWARQCAGPLTRQGRPFPDSAADLFSADVVAVAEGPDGAPLGYVAYDRGRGYREGAELSVHEAVSLHANATVALLRSLGRWHPVAAHTLWRGPSDDLRLLLPTSLPPPVSQQSWMVRVVDPVRAVAERGWAADVDVGWRLVDPETGADRLWRLQVRDGAGSLEAGAAGQDRQVAVLHVRGLALLLSGATDTAGARRLGLLDGTLPGLDAALAGPAPVLLDYF